MSHNRFPASQSWEWQHLPQRDENDAQPRNHHSSQEMHFQIEPSQHGSNTPLNQQNNTGNHQQASYNQPAHDVNFMRSWQASKQRYQSRPFSHPVKPNFASSENVPTQPRNFHKRPVNNLSSHPHGYRFNETFSRRPLETQRRSTEFDKNLPQRQNISYTRDVEPQHFKMNPIYGDSQTTKSPFVPSSVNQIESEVDDSQNPLAKSFSLPPKPLVHISTSNDVPQLPDSQTIENANTYANLDGDDDGGRKKGRLTKKNSEIDPIETDVLSPKELIPSIGLEQNSITPINSPEAIKITRALSKSNTEERPRTQSYSLLQRKGGRNCSLPLQTNVQMDQEDELESYEELSTVTDSLLLGNSKQAKRLSKGQISTTLTKPLSTSTPTFEAEDENGAGEVEDPEETQQVGEDKDAEGAEEVQDEEVIDDAGDVEEEQITSLSQNSQEENPEREDQTAGSSSTMFEQKKRKLKVIVTLKISKKPKNLDDGPRMDFQNLKDRGKEISIGGEPRLEVEREGNLSFSRIGDDQSSNNNDSCFSVDGIRYSYQFESCQDELTRQVPGCKYCMEDQSDLCLFKNLRALPVEQSGRIAWNECIFRSPLSSPIEPILPSQNDLNRFMDRVTNLHLSFVCAKSLLPLMKEALKHAQTKEIVYRPSDLRFRHYCDFCNTGLFASSFICRKCGQEFCIPCQQKMPEIQDEFELPEQQSIQRCADWSKNSPRHTHCAEDLLPVTGFSSDELELEIQAMQEIVSQVYSSKNREQQDRDGKVVDELTDENLSDTDDSSLSSAITDSFSEPRSGTSRMSEDFRIQRVLPSHPVSKFDSDHMNEMQFLDVWSQGVPLVTIKIKPRTEWNADTFQECYGDMECLVVRSDEQGSEKEDVADLDNYRKSVTVRDFFETFEMNVEERKEFLGEGSWKLKDWPPAAEMQASFPDLYEDFNEFVPMPDHTRRDGCKNLSSLFAKNANVPDLGPKMYIAWPGEHRAGGQGTTKLHMDIADAVNVLLYASKDLRIMDGHAAAQWDIFRAEDSDKIRQFLRQHCGANRKEDPIHSQEFFLDDYLLQKLYEQKGVYSWRILQHAGEAVFIPAGCAHQVCNLTDCIKIAVDFLSPYNIERCFKITDEFRAVAGEDVKSWKEDVLQLHSQLWYAWCSCKKLLEE